MRGPLKYHTRTLGTVQHRKGVHQISPSMIRSSSEIQVSHTPWTNPEPRSKVSNVYEKKQQGAIMVTTTLQSMKRIPWNPIAGPLGCTPFRSNLITCIGLKTGTPR
mmetsp:Transcript_117090/g.292099  ORF Transcript_117090/g.292099 Transcript_117090/m.292099 type:complete len:106 (+) Transcript_117090:36-353(+)